MRPSVELSPIVSSFARPYFGFVVRTIIVNLKTLGRNLLVDSPLVLTSNELLIVSQHHSFSLIFEHLGLRHHAFNPFQGWHVGTRYWIEHKGHQKFVDVQLGVRQGRRAAPFSVGKQHVSPVEQIGRNSRVLNG